MRLIGTLSNTSHAERFVSALQSHDISCEWEQIAQKDWGDEKYGESVHRIWIINEDDLNTAVQLLDEFTKNPNDPKYEVSSPPPTPTSPHSPGQLPKKDTAFLSNPKASSPPKPLGPITLYLLLTCIWLFIWSVMTAPAPLSNQVPLPRMATQSSPIIKNLLFDYPETYTLSDQLLEKYGPEALENPQTMPDEGQHLLVKALSTPIWQGIYPHIVSWFKGESKAWAFNAPLFEKIRDGEIWRLFTPCLLHSQIFHILFNMLWLIVLGKQMESHMQKIPFVAFLLITGIFSNLSQYIMSGSNFIGFSGILCAMLTYIWTRQKRSPWEGYQLEKNTMGLITIFILGVFALQVVSFITEISIDFAITSQIANTAHLSGAFIGWVCARTPFFHRQK